MTNKTNIMALIAAALLPQGSGSNYMSLITPTSTRNYVAGFRRPRPGWRLIARKRAYRELAYRRRRNA